jgi:subtilisin family serine protease
LDSGINNEYLIHERYNAIDNSNITEDKFNHGTKVFEIIRKMTPKKQEVKYYDIQVLNDHGLGTVENVCKGIKKAIEFDVDIISMSLGFTKHNADLYDCVKRATDSNIVVVAASGDTLSDDTDYPAKYDEVLSVAAVDENNNLFSFSSTGKIDFTAPGVDIKTRDNKNKRTKESGSSFAVATFVGIMTSYFTEDGFDINEINYEFGKNSGNLKKIVYNSN